VVAVYAPGKDTKEVGREVPDPVTWTWMQPGYTCAPGYAYAGGLG
jgi:hypothetical protein